LAKIWTKNLDLKLLIVEKIIEFYEKHKKMSIRRSVLLRLSEDSMGDAILGGAFERALVWLEREDAVKRIRDNTLKKSEIFFDIPKIRNLRNKMLYKDHYKKPDKQTTHEELEERLTKKGLESTLEEGLLKKIRSGILEASSTISVENKKSMDSERIVRDAVAYMLTILASRAFEFDLNGTSINDSQLVSKQTILDLTKAVAQISSGSPHEPFEITVKYNGIPEGFAAIDILMPEILTKLIPHVTEFAETVLDFKFSNEDMNHLSDGSVDLLSQAGRACFEIFWKNNVFPSIKFYERITRDARL
jgi:hypothetical protein